jgi:hypothetical protein
METARDFWARVSYWLLFIVAPTVAAFFLLSDTGKSGAVCVGIFIVLVVIGEHGFRRWKRLFGIL